VHLALVGTTASGKSALALEVARLRPDIELVSVDSMQVYRGMDIGTAKPTAAERAEVPHHLLDLVEPTETFTVAAFQRACAEAVAGIEERGNRALLVGGTGLYLRAAVDGLTIPGRWPAIRADLEAAAAGAGPEALHARLAELDPVAAARMEPGNARRVVRALEVTLGSGRPFSSFGPGLAEHGPSRFRQIGVTLPAPVVAERIAARYRAQLDAGFLDEVRTLAALGDRLSATAAQALGYRELLAHLRGASTLEEAVDLAVRRTRQFARHQRAWFRRDPRIAWLEADLDPGEVLDTLLARVDQD
jgi:tRNA dimethylallyltransferase